MYLFLDTETTGFPRRNASITEQPYMVQLAAILCDDQRQPVAQVNHLVMPEGWVIPIQASAVHGYTTEFCRRNGRPLKEVLRALDPLWSQASLAVAHNASFDLQILQFSCIRTGVRLATMPSYCTMRASTDIVNLPGGKWPRLEEAYEFFFGEELSGAHDALADVRACMKVFFALKDCSGPVRAAARPRRRMAPARMRAYLTGLSEVEEHQRLVDSLTGLHRSVAPPVDWCEILERPDAQEPLPDNDQERVATFLLRTYQPGLLDRILRRDVKERARLQAEVILARERDLLKHDQALKQYHEAAAEVKRWRTLAEGVSAGDPKASYQALLENSAFETSFLGRDVTCSFPCPGIAEVVFYANGEDIIPAETKRLLATGRVSVRAISKRALGALYQDHVCSCALRIARDVFAILPVSVVLVHASADCIDSTTGHHVERCILSVAFPRDRLLQLNFENLDPSDSMQNFTHRMRYSRKEMDFVEPLDAKAVPATTKST